MKQKKKKKEAWLQTASPSGFNATERQQKVAPMCASNVAIETKIF